MSLVPSERDARVSQTLGRLRDREVLPLPARMVASVAFGVASTATLADMEHSLLTSLVAVFVAVLALASSVPRIGCRSASGAIDPAPVFRAGPREVALSVGVPALYVVVPMFIDIPELLAQPAVAGTVGGASSLAAFVLLPRWADPPVPRTPPRAVVDPRLDDPDAAALVALLDMDVDLRADVALEVLRIDTADLLEVVRGLHDRGLVRVWDDKRVTVTALDPATADPRHLWLGLTGAGRRLLADAPSIPAGPVRPPSR